MKTKNAHIFGEWFIGIETWKVPNGPYHVWPALVWIEMADLDIHVRGGGIALLWWNCTIQIHFKKWHQLVDDRQFKIQDEQMEWLLDEMRKKYGWRKDPDPALIRKVIAKKQWLRVIFANGGINNSYALHILSNELKESA